MTYKTQIIDKIWLILYGPYDMVSYDIDIHIDHILWFQSLKPIEKLYVRGFSKGSFTIVLC